MRYEYDVSMHSSSPHVQILLARGCTRATWRKWLPKVLVQMYLRRTDAWWLDSVDAVLTEHRTKFKLSWYVKSDPYSFVKSKSMNVDSDIWGVEAKPFPDTEKYRAGMLVWKAL